MQKLAFVNYFLNHVAAVIQVNGTLKKVYAALIFITKLPNWRKAFASVKWVTYVGFYVQVKWKYGLSFIHRHINLAKALRGFLTTFTESCNLYYVPKLIGSMH